MSNLETEEGGKKKESNMKARLNPQRQVKQTSGKAKRKSTRL